MNTVTTTQIASVSQLERLVEETGFLPFFRCGISGFSLEEKIAPQFWFADGMVGAWQWREEIAAKGSIAYAKLFRKNAGFVSMKWYPDLCNYRRDGYDFDARYEDGLATRKCKRIVDALTEHGPLLTRELKQAAGFGKDGEKGFETAITTLQMQTYVTVKEFVYKRDKYGKPYGWGVSRYVLADDRFGRDVTNKKYTVEPSESCRLIAEHMGELLPDVEMTAIRKLIK